VAGAGRGVAIMGAVTLVFTLSSLALGAGRTRWTGVRVATVVVRRVVVVAAGVAAARVAVTVFWVVVVVASAGVAVVVAGGGNWAALGAVAAVLSAVWLVAAEPGVSSAIPRPWGWLAYQATPPIAARATTPAATAAPFRPRRAGRVS
jgi:hypothetical protein